MQKRVPSAVWRNQHSRRCSKSSSAALRDMAHHIDLAMQFVQGMDFEVSRDATRTVYAGTRCLELISAAGLDRNRDRPGGPGEFGYTDPTCQDPIAGRAGFSAARMPCASDP